jgi:CelD/BcsL family acetyltransferase involved in cellulose biosynthesis
MPAYETTLIRSLQELRAFLPEWQAFLRADATGQVFYRDPSVVEQHLASGAATPLVAVVRAGGRIQCIAPCRVERSRYRLRLSVLTLLSLPVRRVKVFGDDFVFSGDADAYSAGSAALAALRDAQRAFDLVYLESIRTDCRLWQLLTAQQEGYRLINPSNTPEKLYRMRLRDSFEATFAALPKKTRKNYKWQVSKFNREIEGEAELVRVSRPEQVVEFTADLDRIFRRTWQAKTFGERARDDAQTRAYFTCVAEGGWLRSYVLRVRDVPVAFVVGYQYDGTFHYDEIGYDQTWSELGPGTVLNHLMLEDLHAEIRPELIDFGYGEAQYKRALANEEHEVCSAYLVPRNRWRPVLATQRLLNQAYAAGHSGLVRLRLDDAVRRLLKRKPAAGEA